MSMDQDFGAAIRELAQGGGPVLEALAKQSENALQHAGLDPQTALLVRIAALVALDAAPASYLVHLGIADSGGMKAEAIEATLIELAPLVGSARIVSAAGKIDQALRELSTP
ncbi:carboxymuconolactone decarboxylase family protein [Actinoplanes sp. CA-030573]|uniref:carboxymuconolactone decarboxylase family protein n=1 Tax=Actinoplanes sp. CA-030573 TaxID=3239898 RepID=UPI003D8CE0D4